MDTNILISFRPAVSELLEGAGTVPAGRFFGLLDLVITM